MHIQIDIHIDREGDKTKMAYIIDNVWVFTVLVSQFFCMFEKLMSLNILKWDFYTSIIYP